MEKEFDLAVYYPIFIYLVLIVGFAVTSLVLAHIIGPRSRKTPVKQMPYESGMDPIGGAHQRVDVKFYLMAITFLVFDVELLILYPWAASAFHEPAVLPFGAPTEDVHRDHTVFWVVLVFLALLVVAYVYDWRKGVFKWR